MKPQSRQEATRFLTQATFGPTSADIDSVMAIGYSAWIDQQFTRQPEITYQSYWNQRTQTLKTTGKTPGIQEINHLFWRSAVVGQDQLRERVALALSEIFVVSLQDGCGTNSPLGVASYIDMLSANAFGKYGDLLESVAKHPIMGCYLSHLHNQKSDVRTGRVPDENFARELMQLFSIGLVQLNQDGTVVKNANGQPVETYSASDVSEVARVFTGWSWDCPLSTASCFLWGADGRYTFADRWIRPMRPYPAFYDAGEKKVLGKTIPANVAPEDSLKYVINLLATHSNTAPFISKQLIQRLVTSNPSPAYVKRVALVFSSSNGDLKATVKAILLDDEARDMGNVASTSQFGKVREPLMKVTALLRAYGGKSASGAFLMWPSQDVGVSLGQSFLFSPSVFNFFRPGFSPANSQTSANGLVAPELQILSETSVAGYANFMKDGLWDGWGMCGYDNICKTASSTTGVAKDITLDFQTNSSAAILKMTPEAMVEDINQKLMYGTMSAPLKSVIVEAVTSVWMGYRINQSAADAADTARRRVMTALLLTLISPEFQVQQ